MSPTLRVFTRATRTPFAYRASIRSNQPVAALGRRFASQDYGSGEGDPKGGNPQDQGPSPSSEIEHPGPPPPDVGQGQSGSTPSKDSPSGSNYSTSNQGKSAGQGASGTHGSTGNESSGHKSGETKPAAHSHSDEGQAKAKNGAQPKFNTEPPKDVDQEDVKRHNEDVDKRSSKNNESGAEAHDKVGKGFWSGKFSSKPVMLLTYLWRVQKLTSK